MSSNTTSIRGQGPAAICKRYSAYLCSRIYEEPNPPAESNSRFPEEIKKAKQLWNKVLELNKQDTSGAFGQFYRPTGADQNDGGKTCWPILTFRGTDFSDFRGLGFSVSIDSESSHKNAEGWYQDKLTDVSNYVDESKEFYLNKLDEITGSQAEGDAENPSTITGDEHTSWINFGWIHNHPEVRTPAQAENMPGYIVEPMFHQRGKVHFSFLINDVFTIDMKLVYKKDEDGDWLNNLLQGMGKIGPLYQAALKFAEKCYLQEILPGEDLRMMVNGHSLGGGLASACNMNLQAIHEKEGLMVHSLVFNPAGVHENTIAPAPITWATIEMCRVPDEILTSLANYPTKIPIIGQMLRLSKYPDGLPKIDASDLSLPGRSPGKANETWDVPPKWGRLPRLFPVTEQTVASRMNDHGFKNIIDIDETLDFIAAFERYYDTHPEYSRLRVNDWSIPINSLLTVIWHRYGPSWSKTFSSDAWGEAIVRFGNAIKEELIDFGTLLSMSGSYHGMDYALATYEAASRGYNEAGMRPGDYSLPDPNDPGVRDRVYIGNID